MVGVDQLTALMDFLEVHQELALGRDSRTLEGRCLVKRLWSECAIVLNSVSSADCVKKTPQQWRVYYNEYKSKLMRKIKGDKGESMATGGTPNKIRLTRLQERLIDILSRRDTDESLPVPHNLLEHEQYKFVWQEGDDQQPEPTSHTDEKPNSMAHINPQPEPESPINMPDQQPTTPRRRKRGRPRSSQQVKEQDHALSEATARLESMERMSAEATREHAAATNRLAAAIEAIAERLRDPIVIVVQSSPRDTSQHSTVISSDSE